MAVLREYRCAAHGEFESFDGECPYGCSARFVSQEFRTPPGFKSGDTKNSDKTLDSLAADYNLTNMGNRGGDSVMQQLRKRPSERPTWGEVPHAPAGYSQRGEQAVKFNPGMAPGVALDAMKSVLTRPKPMFVGRPKD